MDILVALVVAVFGAEIVMQMGVYVVERGDRKWSFGAVWVGK